eukprot:4814403-Amphidinium_carterae.1
MEFRGAESPERGERRSQKQLWANMVFGGWRSLKLRPQVVVTSPPREHEGAVLVDPSVEVDLLIKHWKPISERWEPAIDELAYSQLLPFVRPIAWQEVQLTADVLHDCIMHAPSTTPGSNGIGYRHLRPLATPLSQVLVHMAHEVCNGAGFPEEFNDFYPQESCAHFTPCSHAAFVLVEYGGKDHSN